MNPQSNGPGRLLTAMVTPMRPDGAVDFAQARRLATALLDAGSDGVVVTGTTGEAPTINIADKVRLWSEVKDAVAAHPAGGAMVAGAGDNCTADSIEFAREALAAGADAILLTVPYYNKPTQEGLFRHFAAIGVAVDAPCILYNVPARTGVNMTAATQLRLSREVNIAGVKEASGDMGQVAAIIEDAPPSFRVWSGNDEDTFNVMALGGYGVISVASHLVGRQIARMIGAMTAGDTERAAAIHRRLLPLVDALFLQTNPIPVKYALNQLGFDCGPFRLPLCDPDEDVAARIMAEVRKHTIDLPLPV